MEGPKVMEFTYGKMEIFIEVHSKMDLDMEKECGRDQLK